MKLYKSYNIFQKVFMGITESGISSDSGRGKVGGLEVGRV
jgi:hypothetical protein